MNFYHGLYDALQSDDVACKERIVAQASVYCNQKGVKIKNDAPLVPLSKPSYAAKCRIVVPQKLSRRKAFDTKEGLATLLHAVAHIEYSAIDLAIDAAYRFRDMPLAFTRDWLEVAADEIRHFQMLEAMLHDLGYAYGDFAVHMGLFDAAKQTQHDVLERMAIVPRFYEATGLDVNPQIIKKLQKASHFPPVQAVIEALQTIYDEEIDHVRKGDRWFKYVCDKRGEAYTIFFDIVARHGLSFERPHIDVQGRKAAGFSCDEIRKMGAETCE